jgi:WD40 repeat protein
MAGQRRASGRSRRWPVWGSVAVVLSVFIYMILLGGGTMLLGFWPAFQEGARPLRVPGVTSPVVRSLAYSPDGRHLVSASDDGFVRIWQTADGMLLRNLDGHPAGIITVAFSPEGTVLASASADGKVRLWRVSDGTLLENLDHPGPVLSLAFAPDGRNLATGTWDGALLVWQVSDGSLLRSLRGHDRGVGTVAFSPDGRLLASGSYDRTVRLWRVRDGSPLQTLSGHSDAVLSVGFSPDSRRLVSGSFDRTVRLWNTSDGKLQYVLEQRHPVWKVVFLPDSSCIMLGTDESTRRVGVDSDVMEPVAVRDTPGGRSLALEPGGLIAASGRSDGTIRIWRLADGAPLSLLEPAQQE